MKEKTRKPFCHKCGTDRFLLFEEDILPAGCPERSGRHVAYTCLACDSFSAHAIPEGGVSPGAAGVPATKEEHA